MEKPQRSVPDVSGKAQAPSRGAAKEGNGGAIPRLKILQDLITRIDRAESREKILLILRTEIKWLISHDALVLASVDSTRTHAVLMALSPVAELAGLDEKYVLLEEGSVGWVIRSGSPARGQVSTVPSYSHAIEGQLAEYGINSLMVVPIRLGESVEGALLFGSCKDAYYSEEDEQLALTLALTVAIALKNCAVIDDARKRIHQIELINEIAKQLTSVLELESLLAASAAAIQKNFGYFDVTIFLLNEDKTELVLEAHTGSFTDFLPHGYRQSVKKGIIGWVCEHNEKVLSNDVLKDPRYLAFEYHDTKSEMALPIRVEGAIIGILNVEDTRLHAFDETDAMVLETLSDQLGIVINNARLYDEVQRANMKLTELDKMKSEFLGIVSHDFRSPLSSIMLAAKSLSKNEQIQAIPRAREYMQLIVEQAMRLNQLAEDTLSITKIESGQLTYYFKIVNMERLIQDAVSMVRFSSRHRFSSQVDPDALFIKGDQAKLRQVVQNLLSNAVKYSPRGGNVTISVVNSSETQIQVAVKDEGIGIQADKMGRLFQKFSRVDVGEAKDIKGAGLGLWICREIIQAHGGTVGVESEFGKGTTVRFCLDKAPV